jgi:non-ribosomal peptide synthetase component F
LPLSYAQQRLWFIDQLNQGSPEYNIPFALSVAGCFDIELARQAISRIVARHESLRTVFVNLPEGPVQVIHEPFDFQLPVVDLTKLDEQHRQQQVTDLIAQDRLKPFALDRDLMMRSSFISTAQVQHDKTATVTIKGILLFNMHHIASDALSMNLLCQEFIAQYQALGEGKPSPFEPLAIQYADYAWWQRQWLTGEVLERQLDYWKAQLSDAPGVHSLPLDYPRPAVKGHQGAGVVGQLSAELTAPLLALAKANQLTPFMLVHAALALVLARYSNNQDIVLGTPVANRLDAHLEPLIGFFVNTLVLRVNTQQTTLADYLNHIRQTNQQAQAHQDVSFEHLVEHCQVTRSTAHTPLFQILFTLAAQQSDQLVLPGVKFNTLAQGQTSARYDINVTARLSATSMSLTWVYDTDLFAAQTIENLNQHMLTLLADMAGDIHRPLNQLRTLDAPQQALLNQGLVGQQVTLEHSCMLALFDKQVMLTPQATAVVYQGQSLSYRQLQIKANRLATFLFEEGIHCGDRVGICVEPSIEQLIGVLAVLKAGATYVPLALSFPSARLAHIIADAKVTFVLLSAQAIESLPMSGIDFMVLEDVLDDDWLEGDHDNAPLIDIAGEDIAYILYTSGSTGKPKGVMVTHQGLNNYLHYGVSEYWHHGLLGSVVSSGLHFDATLTTLLLPICAGGQVQMIADDEQLLATLIDYLMAPQARLFKITPAHLDALSHLLATDQSSDVGHCVVIGGESLSTSTLNYWQQCLAQTVFINEYGPTETGVGCCVYAPAVCVRPRPCPPGRSGVQIGASRCFYTL